MAHSKREDTRFENYFLETVDYDYVPKSYHLCAGQKVLESIAYHMSSEISLELRYRPDVSFLSSPLLRLVKM